MKTAPHLQGRPLKLRPSMLIGEGGEAEIYDLGQGRALKLFKTPNHPAYAGDPLAQDAAKRRLQEHQTKLKAFPTSLPPSAVAPQEVVTGPGGLPVLGYTMPLIQGGAELLRLSQRPFREAGFDANRVLRVFEHLHRSVDTLHRVGIILGDFNDLNVLVKDEAAYLIDLDSAQFGPYLSHVYTEKFLDPLLADPSQQRPILSRPYTSESDWYAYAALLFQSLLFVEPYGGVHRPKDASKKVPHAARSLHRISIFDPEVKLPKVAERYDVLPDDLLHHFHRIFTKDLRGVFPLALIEDVHWSRCPDCGREHARSRCPHCAGHAPQAVRESVKIRGRVTARRLAQTTGTMLYVTVEEGKLRYLAYEDGAWKREEGRILARGPLDPSLRYRIMGEETWMGRAGTLVHFGGAASTEASPTRVVDTYRGRPQFDVCKSGLTWLQGGALHRNGILGPERIGDVLEGQTLFWTGDHWGVGFYHAQALTQGFIFESSRRGVRDGISLPALQGQLVEARAHISEQRAWLYWHTRHQGRAERRVMVLSRSGSLLADESASDETGHWMDGFLGACAVGEHLLVPTDEGIVRMQQQGSSILRDAEFPDTRHFVRSDTRLLASTSGLLAAGRREVVQLEIR